MLTPSPVVQRVRSLLELVAANRPLLVLVDDAHWLDDASIDALLFAARRLAGLRVALLMAARRGEPDRIGDAIPALDVPGLDLDAAHALLASASDDLAPMVSQALSIRTAGNPLALVEIPRLLTAAQRAGSAPLDELLAPGPTLQRAFARQLAPLAGPVRTAMLVAASADGPDLGTITRALDEVSLDLDALEPAEAAGLLRLESDRLVFRHPLVRAGV